MVQFLCTIECLTLNQKSKTMKKLFNQLLLFAVIGSVVLLTSCGDDDSEDLPAGPSIDVQLTSGQTITDDTVRAESGGTISFDVDITAPGGFNVLRVTNASDNSTVVEITRTDLQLEAPATVVPTIPTGDLPLPDVTEDAIVTLDFTVVDDANQTAVTTVVIEVESDPSVTIYNTFLLAAPLGDGTSETFFSTTTGEKYSYNEVTGTGEDLSSEIDFGYYYGVNNKATLAGIEAYPTSIVNVDAWNNQNVTLFRTTTMTEAEFDAISEFDSDDIAAEFEVGTAEVGEKTNLTAGTVLAFKTDAAKTGGSKFGLLKVVSVVGTDGQGDGINIEVKVNK